MVSNAAYFAVLGVVCEVVFIIPRRLLMPFCCIWAYTFCYCAIGACIFGMEFMLGTLLPPMKSEKPSPASCLTGAAPTKSVN